MNREQLLNNFESGNYDDLYADYIMKNADGERVICNGDTLLVAMEEGFLADEFFDFLMATKGLV